MNLPTAPARIKKNCKKPAQPILPTLWLPLLFWWVVLYGGHNGGDKNYKVADIFSPIIISTKAKNLGIGYNTVYLPKQKALFNRKPRIAFSRNGKWQSNVACSINGICFCKPLLFPYTCNIGNSGIVHRHCNSSGNGQFQGVV